MSYARKWAKEHGMELDESLTLRDDGLSAFRNTHIKRGALGMFLAAVEAGKVPPGSTLIVESLDRLSRIAPIDAQAQMTQIITSGVQIVTASDNTIYSRETITANPYQLFLSLGVMIRAHEESATKSKRITAQINSLCKRWQSGEYRGQIRNGKDPSWVKWSDEDGKFVIVPEHAQAILTAIRLFRQGHGGSYIALELSRLGLQATAQQNSRVSLYRAIKRRDLVGERVMTVDGQEYVLQNYYPALITESEWQELNAQTKERARRKGKGEIPGVITGLKIARCGYCGAAIVGSTLLTRKRKPDGTVHDGHRRLSCANRNVSKAFQGEVCPHPITISAAPIERAIFQYCSDQMNLDSLLSPGPAAIDYRAAAAEAAGKAAHLRQQLERVTEAMLSSDSPVSIFAAKARQLESELKAAEAAQALADAAASQNKPAATPESAKRFEALIEGILAQNTEARMQARQLVKDTFELITIYTVGLSGKSKHIEINLLSKTGNSQWLMIDRKRGDLIQMQISERF